MERYIVSARKYRPQAFEAVVGQQHITATLENAIKNNHLAQALLFCGPRGVGKTTCARILAKMINAENAQADEDFAFNIFELDAASNNSVEDIRRLIDQVRFAPQIGKFKVYIIDEVHMLSQQAFNAFLKTLEEPPAHAIFILATTEKHKIIPTILSRCQIFDFKRITVDDIAHHLAFVAEKEGIKADPEGLHIIAQKADGALRDALSIFDRLVSFTGENITYQSVIDNLDVLDYDYFFKATDLALQGNRTGLLLLFDEILDRGFEGIQFVNGWASHLRDLMVCLDPKTIDLLEVGPTQKQRYLAQSQQCNLHFIFGGLRALNECDIRYKNSNNQRLLVEISLLEILALTEKKNPDVSKLPNHPQQQVPTKAPNNSEIAQTVAKPIANTQREKEPNAQPETPIKTPIEAPAKPTSNASISSPQTPISQPVEAEKQASTYNEVADKKQPDWLTKLSGKSGISIKTDSPKISPEPQTEETNKSENDAAQSETKNEIFSEHAFNQAWQDFLKQIENKKSISAVLTANKPVLKNLTDIHLTLENNTQVSYLQSVQTELVTHLRNTLNNQKVNLVISIAESQSEYRPYTAEERYKAMAAINPQLEVLRKALDMDIE